VDVETGTREGVNQSLQKIKPLGMTPLAYSALQVIDKLRSSKMKATIILVTDGIESCGGNICDVVKAAKKEGIDFRLHIIGFGLKANETEQLRCAAKEGDGRYFDAADAGGLGDVLNEATAATVDKPAGNFSLYAIKNGKPIDALVKATKTGTKEELVLARTYGDTAIFYLPAGKYTMKVVPLENSDINAISIPDVQGQEGKIVHQTVSFDGGKFKITASNNGEGWDAIVKVYEQGTRKTIASGRTYGKSPFYEVNPGLYDLEVTAMVIEGTEISYSIKNVELKAGETKNIEHDFKSGVVMIGAKSDAGMVDAIVKITDTKSKKNVASGRTYTAESSNPKKFVLNPGVYEISVSGLGKDAGKNSSFSITVKEGQTIEKIAAL
jgi:Ca-activated chloride channel family protein